MGEIAFRHDEKVGLAAALVLHGALVAVLLLQTVRSEVSVFPERMTVSLATEMGLEAASPEPVAESRAAMAPKLAEVPVSAPGRTPAERAAPAQSAPTRDRSHPDRTPPKPSQTSAKMPERSGAPMIGSDFLDGSGSSARTDERRSPAARFGAAEQAALSSAITRQLRPHWSAPSGVDTEKLVSIVSWKLNQDGTLRGRPTCQTTPVSITESNRPQASLHCERAIRAVQLAAPFNLPEQFYDRWDDLEWQFDRRL